MDASKNARREAGGTIFIINLKSSNTKRIMLIMLMINTNTDTNTNTNTGNIE